MDVYGKDNKNISMTRGDSEKISVNGLVLLPGDIIYMTVKDSIHTTTTVFQKKVTVFDNGNAVIEIEPNDTKKLKFKKYVYDIQLTRENGEVTTIIKPHELSIEGEVTYD